MCLSEIEIFIKYLKVRKNNTYILNSKSKKFILIDKFTEFINNKNEKGIKNFINTFFEINLNDNTELINYNYMNKCKIYQMIIIIIIDEFNKKLEINIYNETPIFKIFYGERN